MLTKEDVIRILKSYGFSITEDKAKKLADEINAEKHSKKKDLYRNSWKCLCGEE